MSEKPENDQIAEWLGDMPEAYNVTGHTDEQTTIITIDVDALAQLIAERIAARQAEVLRTVAAEIGLGPTVRVLVERESCDWWIDKPVASLLRERAHRINPPERGGDDG